MNISVFLITQNLFHLGRPCRDISLNAKYTLVLKTCVRRINSTIWRNRYIPKIVTFCTRSIWMRQIDLTGIFCQIYRRTRMIY